MKPFGRLLKAVPTEAPGERPPIFILINKTFMMIIHQNHHRQHYMFKWQIRESDSGDRTCIMWTLMADGEATEAIGVVADIKRESKFSDG